MKILLALILISGTAFADSSYFVLESNGLISNVIVAPSSFSPGTGKTKVLLSDFPTAKMGDTITGGALFPVTGPDMSRDGLKTAMIVILSKVTDPLQVARIYPVRDSISSAFDDGLSLQIIKVMVVNTDVSDDAYLDGLKTQILALPQWP